MSQTNNNEYINGNIYPINTSKTEIILSLITEISNLEEKIANLKKASNEGKNESLKTELENLKQTKNKLNKEINTFQMNLLLDISNKNNQIKKKQYSIKEITKKIYNYKNILSSYDNLAFNSPVLKKYIMTNNYNQFLTDEQIDDILSKTQSIVKNENLIQKTEKECHEKKDELNSAQNEHKKILDKINETKENIKMLKEEKIIANNELVNYISLKETLESIIKTNLISLLPKANDNTNNNNDIKEEINIENDILINKREKYSRNKIINDINNIQIEQDNNDNNTSRNFEFGNINKKIWEEIFILNKYEIFNLDYNKVSSEISNDIFDLINSKLNLKNNYNNISMGKSIALEKNQGIKILGKGMSQKINDRYNTLNSQTISYDSPIIKRTKSNIVISYNNILGEYKEEFQNKLKKEIKILIYNINENKISLNNMTDILSDIIINILNEKGYKLNKKNLMIYLSCILKKLFYENQISSKIKFINKDYKSIKKLKKKLIDKLQDQLTKLNSKIESINNTIILLENKLKLLNNNVENKKNKVDKNEIIDMNGTINLSLDEQNYIQLCRKANSFINEKNEIEKEINIYENDKKLQIYQDELKIKNMKNELNELDKQIISKEKELKDNKRKNEENISQLEREMNDKYLIIKENLILFKRECNDNYKQNEYNELLEKINNSIKNEYYKTLFNLKKFYIKIKKPEINIDNMTINENTLKTNRSFNYNSFREKTKNQKLFSFINDGFSPFNNQNKKNLFEKNIKTFRENLEHTSNKKNIYQNRIKNNFINIYDSYNNLNNYFFQFQTPSTMVNFNKVNNENNIITHINNNNEVNNISNSTPFTSSSKVSSSKKKCFYPSYSNDIKPKNLIYNLRYLSSEKNTHIKSKSKLNINDFKLTQNTNDKRIISGFSLNKINSKSKKDLTSRTKTFINFEEITISNKKIFCYFRIIHKNKNNSIFNPIKENTSLINICQRPFNFIKSTIYLDIVNKKIKIFPSNQLEPIEIKSEKIECYKINSLMNQIISIYKDYKIFKLNNNNKDDINLFIKQIKKEKNCENLDDEEIKKCCFNQKFSLEIILFNEQIFEFLFMNYDEYKFVNDNIKSIIKDKKEVLYEMFKINKFEYPKKEDVN